MKSQFRDIIENLVDLINPLACLVCDIPVDEKNNSHLGVLCNSCLSKLPITPNGYEILDHIKSNFGPNEFCIDYAHSLFGVRQNMDYIKIIYALKYYSIKSIASIFGAELARIILNSNRNYDYLIPVPIHIAKERERGFNQSELIAQKISNITGIPISNDLIKRKKYTTSQTLLNHQKRQENVKNIYEINKLTIEIEGKNFLIIDDVLTTGSTINNIAEILKSLCSGNVDAATIAFAK